MIYGVWQSFDSAAILLSQAGFPLIAKPVVRGSFAECIAVDPNKLQTKIPEQLGYPLCTEHGIIEGLVVRPVRGRMSGEARKWIKNKSWHFLEERPNELAKSLREPEDFRRLYLHLCIRPRLRNVLSHDPQLRNTSDASLHRAQEMFRQDLEADLAKRIARAGKNLPDDFFAASRAVADQCVAKWMMEECSSAQPVSASPAVGALGYLIRISLLGSALILAVSWLAHAHTYSSTGIRQAVSQQFVATRFFTRVLSVFRGGCSRALDIDHES